MTALLLECERCGRLRRYLFSEGAGRPMLCVTCFEPPTAADPRLIKRTKVSRFAQWR